MERPTILLAVTADGDAYADALRRAGFEPFVADPTQLDAVPPVDALRRAGVPMAVASDCNPGTSPLVSLPLAMHLACTRFGLTVAEAVAGATRHAARALGLAGEIGVIAPGALADLVVWDADRPAQVLYWVGLDPVAAVLKRGRFVVGGPVPPSAPSFG